MAEYIEKNVAIVRLTALEIGIPYATMTDAKRQIADIPAADVAPVVRCKDCRWHRERDEQERKYLVEGVLICTNSEAMDDGWNPMFPDDFCSYGERK